MGEPDSPAVRLAGDDVLEGRDGWLFEVDNGRRVLAQMRGDLMLARKAALRWLFVLESRIAWLGDRGIPYVFGVAPCKTAVLAEHLPLGVVVSPRRPIGQLFNRIAQDGSFAQIVYPLDELRAEVEAQRPTFSRQESRWNANGAFVAYRRLLAAIPRSLQVRRLARGDIAFDTGMPVSAAARVESDNGVEGEGRMVVTACDAAPPVSCLFFGGSSAYRMLPFLAESFRLVVFVHLHTLDHELVEAEHPDVVVTLADETALIDVPADVKAPRARELAAE